LQATLARRVESAHLPGKKYESLLPSHSTGLLLSMAYGGTTVALINLAVRGYFDMGEPVVSQEKPLKESGQTTFLTGDIVPVSGIWRPDHDQGTKPADLWLRKQDSFPYCLCCDLPASFFLVQGIPHISEDPDFQ
jgi:hypothetical protein